VRESPIDVVRIAVNMALRSGCMDATASGVLSACSTAYRQICRYQTRELQEALGSLQRMTNSPPSLVGRGYFHSLRPDPH
jgi:hypothetical protein